MSGFTFPTIEHAPEASRATLAAVKGKFGFIPNLLSGLSNAPVALDAYLGLAEQFGKSSLSAAEQHVVMLSVSTENRCEYCVAVHSIFAGKQLGAAQVDALRAGRPLGDNRLDAIANFTRAVVGQRGWVFEEQLASFLAAGFTRAQALEVIVGVAQKTLSNYANHLLGTPLDEAFAGARWKAEETSAA